MLKRIILAATMMCALIAQSQTGVGNWRVHPYYVGSEIKNVIDTDGQIYYQVGSYLFCLDKDTDENESLNKSNYLNDVTITGIYYNYNRDYLLIAYANSNIDVIDDAGNVINLPEIKDAVLTSSKGINDITFGGGKIYVATQFGYVVYDDHELKVTESRIYGQDVSSIARVGKKLIMSASGQLLVSLASAHNETMSAFTALDPSIAPNNNARLLMVDKNTVLVNGDNGLYTLSLDTLSSTTGVQSYTQITPQRATTIQPTPSGYIASYLTGDSCYYTLDNHGANPERIVAANELYTIHPEGDGTLWALGERGLHHAGDTQNYYKPDGLGIKVGAFYMAYSEGQNRLYVTSSSDNLLNDWGSKLGTTTQIFCYDGNHWSDVTPDSLPGNGASSNWQMVVDPFDNNTYVYPSRKYGVVKVTNDRIVNVYNEQNSLFMASNYYKGACAFDAQGNLWVVYSSSAASDTVAKNVAVLPRAKYEQSRVSPSDWVAVSVPGTKQSAFKGSNLVIANGVNIFNSGDYQRAFAFWTQPNGITSTPRRANHSSFTDQDGKNITWNNVYSMVADHNGIVWVGFNNGVINFDPTRAFDDDFTINHIKVPRNDGTGLADYLLDGSQINCIAVDGANRKWIGTNNSGLFLVSADGSQVLKQFTTDNSYLSTNTIYSVCCNPTNNSVYVITPNDFLEYFSDTTPGAVSYSNVYVYPNPVRPDFTGEVTIVGLMDNSLVKIADSGGHVVKQLRSTGGMATWDCLGDNGERVSTGVYYVLASEKEGGTAHATVAKFLVVK